LCGGTPREQPELYASRSPVTIVSHRSLPTLILHGELDQCVPVSQARELFTTLTTAKVAAELVVYPGEGHQVQRIEYRRDQRQRILQFLRGVL
jgi:dipeptidyl aminopeptidase/acylaminoacyl peptidase